MKKIVRIEEAVKIAKEIKRRRKSIVLAGGCFDILHKGHIEFLKKAKNTGDFLFVLLESDENIKRLKGKGRPVNNQVLRAKILSSLVPVDYLILLPTFTKNAEYDNLVNSIKPDIIATTKNDKNRKHKERQAKMIHAKVADVIERLPDKSTSDLIKKIQYL